MMKKRILAMCLTCALALKPVTVTAEPSHMDEYILFCDEAAAKFGISSELLQAICEIESNWNPNAVSDKGAVGIAQIMPQYHQALMEEYGVTDLTDAHDCILISAAYISELKDRFDGDLYMVLMYYNQGQSAIEQFEAGNYSAYAIKVTELAYQKEVERYGR